MFAPFASCPPDSTLARFLEQTLSEEEHAALEAHVATCDACDLALTVLVGDVGDVALAPTLEASSTSDSLDVFVRRARLAHEFRAGSRVGRFRVLRQVGQGAMGIVYAAHDPQLDRDVALKVLLDDAADVRAGADGETHEGRLVREARSMAKLAHPHIVTVFEVGVASGRVFLAMQLVEGETLAEWLLRSPPVPTVLGLFVDVARALEAAHRAGVVHRDLKPHNILVSRDGDAKVTDFGLADTSLAVAAAGDDRELPITSTTLLRTRGLVGTPAYMAPEVLRGSRAGPASDQFSFATSLHEALTGQRPWQAETLAELEARVANEPPTIARELPAEVVALLRRALARSPADRFPSMQEVGDELARAMAAVNARALLKAERRGRSRLLAVLGVALAVAAAVPIYRFLAPVPVPVPVPVPDLTASSAPAPAPAPEPSPQATAAPTAATAAARSAPAPARATAKPAALPPPSASAPAPSAAAPASASPSPDDADGWLRRRK